MYYHDWLVSSQGDRKQIPEDSMQWTARQQGQKWYAVRNNSYYFCFKDEVKQAKWWLENGMAGTILVPVRANCYCSYDIT